MALSLAEMVAQGKRKMSNKEGIMKDRYNAAKSTMKARYDQLPFGRLTKAAYGIGIDHAEFRTDPEKWARNWEAGVSK
jgi:hypothetical protein